MASTVMGFEGGMDSSQEELLEARQVPGWHTRHRRTVAFVAGLFAMCAAISFWHYPGVIAKAQGEYFIGLDEEVIVKNCTDLPYVSLGDVISSNLGKQGPDDDKEEGIMYKATEHNTGVNVTNLQIHIHSLSSFDITELNNDSYDKDYEPAFTKGKYVNGMEGKFGIISMKPGKSVKLRVHVYDGDKEEYLPLPHGVMSFFDLDMGPKANEKIRIAGFKAYYVSNETEINVTSDEDGKFTTFAGTVEGTGADNPTDPDALTPLQKNKAFTVEFEDILYADFELIATEGESGRVFSFVFRPSLLCHKAADGSLVPTEGIVVNSNAASKGLSSACLLFASVVILIQSFM